MRLELLPRGVRKFSLNISVEKVILFCIHGRREVVICHAQFVKCLDILKHQFAKEILPEFLFVEPGHAA
jgi:hypothetical protein